VRVSSHVAGLLTGASQALTSSALAVAAHDLQAFTVKKRMEELGLCEKKVGPNRNNNHQGLDAESASASTTRMARESEMTEAASALANATAQLQAVGLLRVWLEGVLQRRVRWEKGKEFIPNMSS